MKAIRLHLNHSQTGMLAAVKPGEDKDHRALISEYERGAKAPDYPTLLRYARLVRVSTDALIDDGLDLILENDSSAAAAVGVSGGDAVAARILPAESRYNTSLPKDNSPNNNSSEDNPSSSDLSADCSLAARRFFDRESVPDSRPPEPLTIYLRPLILDYIDDLYLELLGTVPRELRSFISREDYHKTLVGTALCGYLDNGGESDLASQWQSLMRRRAARARTNEDQPSD